MEDHSYSFQMLDEVVEVGTWPPPTSSDASDSQELFCPAVQDNHTFDEIGSSFGVPPQSLAEINEATNGNLHQLLEHSFPQWQHRSSVPSVDISQIDPALRDSDDPPWPSRLFREQQVAKQALEHLEWHPGAPMSTLNPRGQTSAGDETVSTSMTGASTYAEVVKGGGTRSSFTTYSNIDSDRKSSSETAKHHCQYPRCFKAYDTPSDLKHHMRAHIPKDQQPFDCNICGERFLYNKDLKRHNSKHDSFSEKFSCPVCGHSFSRRDNMERHRRQKNH